MSTEPTTTREHVRALAAAVRDGELTPEQRGCLAALLHCVGQAAALAPRSERIWASNDARSALEYLTGCWQPVERACAELAATVRGSGEEPAA